MAKAEEIYARILQRKVDAFNTRYVQAVTASDARAYYEAALIGRQIVCTLQDLRIVSDASYDIEYAKTSK
jgi:hypothetical protein